MHQGKQLLVFIFLVYSFLMAFIKVHTYLHIFREDHKICELTLLVLMFEKKEGDFSKHLWPSNRTSTTQLVCIKLIALKIVSIYQKHIYPCILWSTSFQALRAWILEFEMSVHRICEFDPFWTKKKILQKDRHTDTQTDGNTHRHSSLDCGLLIMA